tara:strand:+ start:305 stop:799 length:495 start_codon:yes stop_codon:yes gene_type:complete
MSTLFVDEIRPKASGGQIAIKDVPAFYAFNNAAQTLTDSVWTKVNLQDTLFDTTGDFDTSSFRFVAPLSGIYSFTTALNFGTATASGGHNYARVLKNGSVPYYTFGIRITSAVMNSDTQIVGSVLLPLNANEYVEMGAFQDVASGSPTLTNGRCYFTGHLVGAT